MVNTIFDWRSNRHAIRKQVIIAKKCIKIHQSKKSMINNSINMKQESEKVDGTVPIGFRGQKP